MKLPALLSLLIALAIPGLTLAQDKPQILADGDPPLTQQMANDYMHFMQWALRTPLTLTQEATVQRFLVDNWKAGNQAEIARTQNILALRERIGKMGLKDNQWAAYEMGQNAIHNWKASPTMEMAVWGMDLFNSSHKALIAGDPPLTKQMELAYEELGYFMMNVVDSAGPIKIDAVERSQLADTLASVWPNLTADQKSNFALLPKIWVQIRESWPTMDDATKASLKTLWKANFYPAAKTASTPPKKGAKPAAPPPVSTRPQPTINRLVQMTWVTNTDVFSKMSAAGTPYGLGWE